MSVVAVILARLDSRRLPEKGFLSLAGLSVIETLVTRLKHCSEIEHLVLATTHRACDDRLEGEASRLGISCFRGDCDDVLGRVIGAAERYDGHIVVRANGDSPFLSAEAISLALNSLAPELAMVTGKQRYTGIPAGLCPEVVRLAAMKAAYGASDLTDFDKEHVTKYLLDRPEQFAWEALVAPADWRAELEFTLDTPEDFLKLTSLAENLSDTGTAEIPDLITGLLGQEN